MITPEPGFMEWVEVTLDGWKLKDDAPPKVIRQFAEYMESLNEGKETK